VRVLYFSRDYTPHDHRFLSALAESVHRVYYLRLESRGRALEERPAPQGVEQVAWSGGSRPMPRGKYPLLIHELEDFLARVQPDLVHAGPIQSPAYLTAMAGYHPLVTMSWGSDLLVEADSSAWMKRATKKTLGATDILLGDCRAVRDRAVSDFGFPAERIVTFPWGIDLDHFSSTSPELRNSGMELRRKLGWEDNFVLLSTRTWEPIYGVDVVVRGFVLAVRSNPDLRLILLGDGSQSALIRRILSEGQVKDKVYFGGHVSNRELPAYYHAADLYLSASHSDGSSVSLMEALASGLPAIVSDIPGNREWIKPGREGWLFADGNAQELAQTVLLTSSISDGLGDMVKSARRLAEQRADWKKNFQQLLRAYEMAVE